MRVGRSEHKHQGDLRFACRKCGLWAWQHRTRDRANNGHGTRTRRELTTFIGIDGEGVARADGSHDYVLLTVGDECLRHDGPGRLTWREIFPFLYECFEKDPHAAYVGFYLGYDFTQWLRTLPRDRAKMLFSKEGIAKRRRKQSGKNPRPFPVHIGDARNPYQWEIDILGMKRFKIRPGVGSHAKPDVKNHHKWMNICDVGAFFQSSFLVVLKGLMGKKGDDESVLSKAEYETIKQGKERRASAVLDDEMIRYNLLECNLLSRVMPLLNDGFKSCGIKLTAQQWFGPGQAAQEWMKNIEAPTREIVEATVPIWARDVGRKTYYGGWFEIPAHGHIPGETWEYDLNSAYPKAISELPCLLHGTWKQGTCTTLKEIEKIANRTLVAVHGLAQGSDERMGTLMHRTRKGIILRPRRTSGWYWLHEIQAAMRAGMIDTFTPDEWVSYEGCNCPKPFRAMLDLYQERLRVGKNTPRGKAMKLIYNSAYGKCAQSVGQPKFANPIYASLITCSCRTRVLDAIATHPKKTRDLLMVATDGVYFKTRHLGLEIDPERLGAWSESVLEDGHTSEIQNLLLFMPGLYWDDRARRAFAKGDVKLKSRGVPGRAMARKILEADQQFEQFGPHVSDEGNFVPYEWPTVEIDIEFSMTTPSQALARGKWEICGCVTSTSKRTITASPHQKRRGIQERDRGIWFSEPYDESESIESMPYEKSFGDESLQAPLQDVTPDGVAVMLIRELLQEADP